ncbi:hypothetical protein HCN51_36465 [Nonomuraea sp. FMUSA5-5]|uniref:Uncharacterized protein n=1 Tax=Nonomuraea composti TaxID=2720023 RepID=A0ABX1BAP9_9ACTN|nr:hypothetical protein [Nonomuraea sp. FMUSA5-5]NJP94868.1 hypothetical protein [Nonomuraea sp. FMUSA5-5]
MDFVLIERNETGYLLDPAPYLAALKSFASRLPAGARRFATDPDHYDFRSERCVKDLRLREIIVSSTGGAISARATFAFNDIHPEILCISYREVSTCHVSQDPEGVLGPVQLDEIRPGDSGCVHEIQLIGGTILVTCADLDATWRRAPTS